MLNTKINSNQYNGVSVAVTRCADLCAGNQVYFHFLSLHWGFVDKYIEAGSTIKLAKFRDENHA